MNSTPEVDLPPAPPPIKEPLIIKLSAVSSRAPKTKSGSTTDFRSVKKTVLTVAGVFVALVLILRMKPPVSSTVAAPAVPSTTVSTPPAVAEPAKTASAKHHTHHSPSWDLVAHHLYDQDYSLSWKDKGDGYTYHVYYDNSPSMKNAALVLDQHITGGLYRFSVNGDPKNVWMAIAPIDANNHEGKLSPSVNIGRAKNT